MRVNLTRYKVASDRDGTPGKIVTPSGLQLYTGELPWRKDIHDKSCVYPAPDGQPVVYLCELLDSNAFKKKLFHLTKVLQADGTWGALPDGRVNVMIHNGNLFGDMDQGALSQVEGCILLGNALTTFRAGEPFRCADGLVRKLPQNQLGVMSSVDALQRFMDDMGGDSFELAISQGAEVLS